MVHDVGFNDKVECVRKYPEFIWVSENMCKHTFGIQPLERFGQLWSGKVKFDVVDITRFNKGNKLIKVVDDVCGNWLIE